MFFPITHASLPQKIYFLPPLRDYLPQIKKYFYLPCMIRYLKSRIFLPSRYDSLPSLKYILTSHIRSFTFHTRFLAQMKYVPPPLHDSLPQIKNILTIHARFLTSNEICFTCPARFFTLSKTLKSFEVFDTSGNIIFVKYEICYFKNDLCWWP